jgi:hypothetical protein
VGVKPKRRNDFDPWGVKTTPSKKTGQFLFGCSFLIARLLVFKMERVPCDVLGLVFEVVVKTGSVLDVSRWRRVNSRFLACSRIYLGSVLPRIPLRRSLDRVGFGSWFEARGVWTAEDAVVYRRGRRLCGLASCMDGVRLGWIVGIGGGLGYHRLVWCGYPLLWRFFGDLWCCDVMRWVVSRRGGVGTRADVEDLVRRCGVVSVRSVESGFRFCLEHRSPSWFGCILMCGIARGSGIRSGEGWGRAWEWGYGDISSVCRGVICGYNDCLLGVSGVCDFIWHVSGVSGIRDRVWWRELYGVILECGVYGVERDLCGVGSGVYGVVEADRLLSCFSVRDVGSCIRSCVGGGVLGGLFLFGGEGTLRCYEWFFGAGKRCDDACAFILGCESEYECGLP